VGTVHLMSGELVIPEDAPVDLIRAAGGIVTRVGLAGRVEVAVVYREARGDWTFPKGKLGEGESFEQAAVREVHEETGLRCTIARFAGTTSYTHRKGRPKIVAYYLMEVSDGEFAPNAEVDELVWIPLGELRERLTWDRDRELIEVVAGIVEAA
jgi:8-oxo-dGTP pyrophosphatase MutT (NUDIX family)